MKEKEIELLIGYTFFIGKVKIRVVPDEEKRMNCGHCVFDQAPYHMLCGMLACCKEDRSDKKAVHFEVVK